MNPLTLRAFDVRDGWAIVEGPSDELWLVTPPYRDAGRQRISPMAERQLRQHGDFPGADERFMSWGDLTRALVQRRLQAADSTTVPSPTKEARQLLKSTPAHRIDGLVSQAEALLEQGRYDEAERAARVLLTIPALQENASQVARVVDLLDRASAAMEFQAAPRREPPALQGWGPQRGAGALAQHVQASGVLFKPVSDAA